MVCYIYDGADVAVGLELKELPTAGELIALPRGDTFRVKSVQGRTNMFHKGETVEAVKVLIERTSPIAELARALDL